MEQQDTPAGRALLSRRALEIAVALLAIAFGATIILGALEYHVGWSERGPEPGYFPFWMGIIVIIGATGALIQALLSPRFAHAPTAVTADQARRIAVFLAPMLGFLVVALLFKMGLYVGMVVYMLTVMLWQGRYPLLTTLGVSFGTAVFFYFVFERWLLVPLLKGPFEAWLGLH